LGMRGPVWTLVIARRIAKPIKEAAKSIAPPPMAINSGRDRECMTVGLRH